MRKITGKHLLCLFLLAIPLSWAEDTKEDMRKTENDTEIFAGQCVRRKNCLPGSAVPIETLKVSPGQDFWSQVKTRRLFARRKISPPQESRIPKHRSNIMTPARRCSRLMENCSSHVPCCDPCASCRCRLFNTICHCWRMNPLCLKKT